MNILILDKDYISSRAYASEWSRRLKVRKHNVVYETHLINLRALNRNLAEFDVILAHPRTEDLSLLEKELERRKSLRLVLHSGCDSYINLEVINSPQVSYYSNTLLSSKLLEIVEENKS